MVQKQFQSLQNMFGPKNIWQKNQRTCKVGSSCGEIGSIGEICCRTWLGTPRFRIRRIKPGVVVGMSKIEIGPSNLMVWTRKLGYQDLGSKSISPICRTLFFTLSTLARRGRGALPCQRRSQLPN